MAGDSRGTSARVNPSRAASARRRSHWAHLAQLAAEADLAADDQVGRERLTGQRRGQGQAEPEVGTRFDDLHPTDGEGVDVGLAEAQTRRARPARRGAAPAARCRGPAPTGGAWAACSPPPAPAARPAAAGGRRWSARPPTRRRPGAGRRGTARLGSGTRSEAVARHLEQPELVGGAEAVLDRPQQAQRVVAVALEGQHGVDDVLEDPRPGQAAVLGDVADEHHGQPAALGLVHQRAPRTPGPG